MSLLKLLKKKNFVNLFTTPTHSQNFFILSKFRQFYKYDISETDAHNPQYALKQAEEKANAKPEEESQTSEKQAG